MIAAPIPAPIPANELRRLAALRDYNVLDTPPDEAFDRLTRIAAHVLGAPIALISLVDSSRQWFKSRVGMELRETPREWAFCAHALNQDAPLVVLDTHDDIRFVDNPLVNEIDRIRFYVGAQLSTASGEAVGTLCVLDRTARLEVDPAKVQALRDLADLVVEELELRKAGIAAREDARMQKALAEKVQHAHVALQAAYKAKSDFLASLSHELRTPLNAVIGLCDLIATDPDENAMRQSYAHDIAAAGWHMLSLVNDILEFSRIEAEGAPFHPEPLGLREPLEEALRMVAAFARSRDIILTHNFAWPEARVYGDRLRLKQVVLNLLTNAVKFTQAGGMVTLSLAHAPDGQVAIAVGDTGIGMAAADIPRALTPFGQIVPADGQSQEGTGHGLPISKALVERHGGTMIVESTVGVGTCVTVRLAAL